MATRFTKPTVITGLSPRVRTPFPSLFEVKLLRRKKKKCGLVASSQSVNEGFER